MEYVVGAILGVLVVGLGVAAWFGLDWWMSNKIADETPSVESYFRAMRKTNSDYLDMGLRVHAVEDRVKELKAHFGGMQSTNDKRDNRIRHRTWSLEESVKRMQLLSTATQEDVNKLVLKYLELEAKVEEVRKNRPKPDGDSDSPADPGSNGRLTLRSGGRST